MRIHIVASKTFETLQQEANDELEEKQTSLRQTYALGEMKRWWFEQRTAKLQFFDNLDHMVLEVDVVDVGSFAPTSSTWKWAWSNSSVRPELRQKAEPFKQLQAITGDDLFTNDKAFVVDGETAAWELTAMAVKHIAALGCYRAPSSQPGGPHTFLAITAIANSDHKK
jgi:hypothetical protein